jgi:hypothetical protein
MDNPALSVKGHVDAIFSSPPVLPLNPGRWKWNRSTLFHPLLDVLPIQLLQFLEGSSSMSLWKADGI